MRFWLIHARPVVGAAVWPEGALCVENGRICALEHGTPEIPNGETAIDCGGAYITPGFIDTHTHGGGGFDVMDGTPADIIGAARAHLVHGTTTYVPTSMTCPNDELMHFLDDFEVARTEKANMPHLPGVHLEGPFLSAAQAGAQPPGYLQVPSIAQIDEILERANRHVVRWSIAPELAGGMAAGDCLSARGVCVSIGHSDADYECVRQAIAHGYTHLTHFYSGMSGLVRRHGHRILGVIECGYLFDELTVELIADGKHLPPELLRMIVKCKPHSHISLITDSMRGAGMPDGPSVVGSRAHGTPAIIRDGVANLTDFSAFAGSTATTDRLLRTMVNEAGLELPDAVAMLTENPAKLIHLDADRGTLAVGKRADLVLLDDKLYPKRVWVDGNEVPNVAQ